MQAYRLETVMPQDGELTLRSLPFHPGESIEVIILARHEPGDDSALSMLKDTVLKYEDPTEPAADADWAVHQ